MEHKDTWQLFKGVRVSKVIERKGFCEGPHCNAMHTMLMWVIIIHTTPTTLMCFALFFFQLYIEN